MRRVVKALEAPSLAVCAVVVGGWRAWREISAAVNQIYAEMERLR